MKKGRRELQIKTLKYAEWACICVMLAAAARLIGSIIKIIRAL